MKTDCPDLVRKRRHHPQTSSHLNWKEEINLKISSCYAILSVIRKLKHLTPFHVRKQLAGMPDFIEN